MKITKYIKTRLGRIFLKKKKVEPVISETPKVDKPFEMPRINGTILRDLERAHDMGL